MTDPLPAAARTALLDTTDVRVPPDLAGAALALAGRRRRRRALGTVAGAAVLAAAAILVPAGLRADRAAPPAVPATDAPATDAPATDMRWRIVAYDGAGPSSDVLDPAGRGWARLPYPLAVPSPDGRWLLVGRPDGTLGVGLRAELVRDPAAVRWLAGSRGYEQPRWSADGRVLLTRREVRPAPGAGRVTTGFLVVDAARARATPAPFGMELREPLFWGPGARLVGGADHILGEDPPPGGAGGIDVPGGTPFDAVLVLFHDLGGRPQGPTVGCRLPATSITSPPDGRLLAGSGVRTGICDATTGDRVGTMAGAAYESSPWADPTHPVTVDGNRLTVRDLAGNPVATLTADRPGRARLAAAD